MKLVAPAEAPLEAFLRMVAEVQGAEADFASVVGVTREGWAAYLDRVEGLRTGRIPSKAGVPLSTWWLLDDDGEIVGGSTLRHRLTPALVEYGGHVGVAVRPSMRRRGHGATLLQRTLDRGRALGLGRALITCDVANLASRAVIERCGGVLDAEYLPSWAPASAPVPVRRYWMDLGGTSTDARIEP